MFIQDWLHRLKRKYENMRVARSIRSVVKKYAKAGASPIFYYSWMGEDVICVDLGELWVKDSALLNVVQRLHSSTKEALLKTKVGQEVADTCFDGIVRSGHGVVDTKNKEIVLHPMPSVWVSFVNRMRSGSATPHLFLFYILPK